MYREEELTALNRQLGIRRAILWGVTALLTAGLVYAAVSRARLIGSDARLAVRLSGAVPYEIAIYILSAVIGIWALTWWGLALKPLTDYKKHLINVLRGRTHTVDGRWGGVSEEISEVDGVKCRTVSLILQDEKGWDYDRRFYLDVLRQVPDFAEGASVRITYHDKLLVCVEELQA